MLKSARMTARRKAEKTAEKKEKKMKEAEQVPAETESIHKI